MKKEIENPVAEKIILYASELAHFIEVICTQIETPASQCDLDYLVQGAKKIKNILLKEDGDWRLHRRRMGIHIIFEMLEQCAEVVREKREGEHEKK